MQMLEATLAKASSLAKSSQEWQDEAASLCTHAVMPGRAVVSSSFVHLELLGTINWSGSIGILVWGAHCFHGVSAPLLGLGGPKLLKPSRLCPSKRRTRQLIQTVFVPTYVGMQIWNCNTHVCIYTYIYIYTSTDLSVHSFGYLLNYTI